MIPPALFILPQGLTVTGVTTWALALAGELAALDVPTAVIAHGSAPGHTPFLPRIPERVRLLTPELPDIESLDGNLWPLIDAYRAPAEQLAREAGTPAVLIPTRHGDCFAACAALTTICPELVRIVGWRHTPMGYESAVLRHHEPAIAAYAAVTDHLARDLADSLPDAHVRTIHNAIDPGDEPDRPPLSSPLRLISTGRLEQPIKRVRALAALSDELNRRNLHHTLTLVGDGPLVPELSARARTNPSLRILSPRPPAEVRTLLEQADLFVLASRTEGMSVSAMEAMAAGCACVLTRTPSGAADLIPDDTFGVLVDRLNDADDDTLAQALADGVEQALAAGARALGRNARQRIASRFSPALQAQRTIDLLRLAAASPAKRWPTDRPFAFSRVSAASGSTPADAAQRMEAALRDLAGVPVAIHGTGRHTQDLLHVLRRSPADLRGFIDEDPQRTDTTLLGLPVVPPDHAATLGVHAVVISSWMHEQEIYERKGIYERQGITLARLYAPSPSAVPSISDAA